MIESAAQPAAEPLAAAASGERQSYVQLFGPVQNDGSHVQAASNIWQMAGASTSTSFKTFWFNRAWQRITWASLRIEWIPMVRANSLRLIAADDGISNIQVLAEIAGADHRNPLLSVVNVTVAFQQLARTGRQRHIGWQVRGDGRNQLRVYQIHLEILEAV